MGNGASIRVRPEFKNVANAASLSRGSIVSNIVSQTPRSNKDMRECIENTQAAYITALEELKQQLKETEDCGKRLEHQLAEANVTNMEISAQKTGLEEQLEILKNKRSSMDVFEGSVNDIDKHVQRLEAEVKESQEHITILKQRNKRKVKKLQTELVQAKQEAALVAIEMKEKIQSIEERHSTRGKERSCHVESEFSSGEKNRLCLILELSSQVSQQQASINRLEAALEQKDVKLKELEAAHAILVHAAECNKLSSSKQPGSGPSSEHRRARLLQNSSVDAMLSAEDKPPSGKIMEHNSALGQKLMQGSILKLNENFGLEKMQCSEEMKSHRTGSATSTESGVSMTVCETEPLEDANYEPMQTF
ncbi:coiled-coil domain-containing protein 192-like [Polyodon spathula]|uniref:coiled-coil domain-containing protein 192-like n=1 Tax=Polyodon spathula TaxID=7913 RepID=UPI001B7F20A4|nr:coiled-coil domain-containing protein 192-like [Polyodon spathula]